MTNRRGRIKSREVLDLFSPPENGPGADPPERQGRKREKRIDT